MERYDYLSAVIADVRDYIKENELEEKIRQGLCTFDDLYDDCFISDMVTGNASGSYTFNAWRAEEYICHNLDLLKEACDEFCCEPKYDNAEWCDVAIRCYLLLDAIHHVLDEYV